MSVTEMRTPLAILLFFVACRPAAPPARSTVDMEAPLPAEPPPQAPVPEAEPAPRPTPEPAPKVDSPFQPGSPDEDRDPFRSDSVDMNQEGEYILERALKPPTREQPEKKDETEDDKKPASP